MDARERQRLQVAQHATRLLRRAAFRACLEVVDADGGRPVFAALPDDPAAWVFDQVRALGGDANVVCQDEVEPGVHRLAVIVIVHASPREDVERIDLHPDAHFGLLVSLLKRVDGPVHCEVLSPKTVAQLINA